MLEVILDRPGTNRAARLNAVDGTLHRELAEILAELRDQSEARAVLLTARGEAFSAGGDFGWFPELADPEVLEQVRSDGRSIIYDLLDISVPVVCAVGGPAVGLGASIALLCDIIFMSTNASLADPHVQVGIVAGDGGTLAWPLAVGPVRSKQYLLTGDPISASEAERIGLVNFVVPPDELHTAALEFATRLSQVAPLASAGTKAAINAGLKAAAALVFDQAAAAEIETFRSADHTEALNAIMEKRRPAFKGM